MIAQWIAYLGGRLVGRRERREGSGSDGRTRVEEYAMSRETNVRVEEYQGERLAQPGLIRNPLGATHVKWGDRILHGDPPVALFDVPYRAGAST